MRMGRVKISMDSKSKNGLFQNISVIYINFGKWKN